MSRRPHRRRGAVLAAAAGFALAALTAVTVEPAAPLGPVAGRAAGLATASPRRGGESHRRVLVVSAPHLRWADIAANRPAVLTALLERSAIASLSTRTVGPRTNLGAGYATIGAGNRAAGPELDAGLALEPSAPFEGGTGADAFSRRTGVDPRGAALVLSMAGVRQANDNLRYDAHPGALGDALARGRRGAAVVANADTGRRGGATTLHREAALAVMDSRGRVSGGQVSRDLLVDDAAAPFGVRLDPEAVAAAVQAAWEGTDVVLLELSDLARAEAYAPLVVPSSRPSTWARSLGWSDEVLGRVLAGVDWERDVVVVVAPAAPDGPGEQLTVAAVAGRGYRPGLARSATTRRTGYVTLPDVAPTVLASLGVRRPPAMTGTPILSAGGPRPGPASFARLARANERTVFRDGATGPVSVVFVVLQAITYALAMIALVRHAPRLRGAAAFMALVVLAVPVTAFLANLVAFDRLGLVGFVIGLFATGVALAAASTGAARVWRRPEAPAIALVAFTLGVLLADVFTGGRLQMDTVFGYSPTVAGRFAGYGNLAFGVVAMSTIVLGTTAWETMTRRVGDRRSLAPVALLFLVVVVADGHPAWGSDVGGALALVPALAVVALLLLGARLSWPRLAAIGVVTAAALAGFTAADLARPEASRTHLGRLAARIMSGDGGVGSVLLRKVASNLHILTSSVWTGLIPVAIGFLVFLTWRPPGVVRELQRRHAGLRACMVGGLAVGVLGSALNDSGVAIAAIMLAVLVPYLTVLALRLPAPR